MFSSLVALSATSLLLLPSTLAAGLYGKDSPVLQVDGRSYRTLIEKSNATSIIEFYAPWCGHCQNLKPAYEKAAKSLAGLAKVAAVNCDADENKPFCGSMGVQGFPTLKIVRPGKTKGKPIVEDYQGARSAKAIVDTVVDKIPNHVKRLKDADYQAWLEENDKPKAILFSDKGTTSALLKAVAVDFLDSIGVAQIRDKEKGAVQAFDVEKFPTLVLVPSGGEDPVPYNGEMKKDAIVSFLSQAASPNPDPAPKAKKERGTADKSKASKASSAFSEASASHASEEAKTAKASQTIEDLEEDSNPTQPADSRVDEPAQKPVEVPDIAPPIPSIMDGLSLQQKCLNSNAGTCILLLLPDGSPSLTTILAIASLSEIHHKHEQAKRNLFPFYQLPNTNSQAGALRSKLGLSEDVELIAINGKRSWYRHYPHTSFTQTQVEDWIDAIRMGDTPKEKLPESLIASAQDLPPEPVKVNFENAEAMRNAMKSSMPEGVELEMEEVDDETYERLMAQGHAAGQAGEAEHDEL